jgi:hypothetical protein
LVSGWSAGLQPGAFQNIYQRAGAETGTPIAYSAGFIALGGKLKKLSFPG